jgi:hypothetical protein
MSLQVIALLPIAFAKHVFNCYRYDGFFMPLTDLNVRFTRGT